MQMSKATKMSKCKIIKPKPKAKALCTIYAEPSTKLSLCAAGVSSTLTEEIVEFM